MTKVHAYLARIKDQEKNVIAVPDGAGRALCVSFDKHWTFTREWDELHIIAPLVAENAEARTTPAVTRDDIEKAIRNKVWAAAPERNEAGFHRVHIDWATNAVWALLSGDDPAVYVVRESDVAAVKVKWNEDRSWQTKDRGYGEGSTAEGMRQTARLFIQDAVGCEAVARAIEHEAAKDPVEEKARELFDVANADVLIEWERTSEGMRGQYRRLAAHILGQEDRHVDQ